MFNQSIIWLTDSPQWIISTQLGQETFYKRHFCILQIDVSDLSVISCTVKVAPVTGWLPYEFACLTTIPPKYIKGIQL